MHMLPNNYQHSFIGVSKTRADEIVRNFERADIPKGHERVYEVSARKDSPDGAFVNVLLHVRKVRTK